MTINIEDLKRMLEVLSKNKEISLLEYQSKDFKITLEQHPEKSLEKPSENTYATFYSPTVGIFFLNENLKIGLLVKKDQPLGFIKTLDIDNELLSPCKGIIKDILVSNNSEVDINKPLLIIQISKD